MVTNIKNTLFDPYKSIYFKNKLFKIKKGLLDTFYINKRCFTQNTYIENKQLKYGKE